MNNYKNQGKDEIKEGNADMNYQEAMEYIENCASYGIVPGLETINELLRRLGHPQENLKFIHIAGTNGKGSTLAFISEVLRANGYKVGRYVSPTIFEYRERFQIQGKAISKAHVARLMSEVRIHADAMSEEGFSHPTPFEIETAMAFLLFAEKNCDFVVLETGMGGMLDATNVVKNTLVAVINTIAMDHSSYLGDTLEKIASHKTGIIKKDCVVVSSEQTPEVRNIINKIADEKKANKVVFVDSAQIKKTKFDLKKTIFTYRNWDKMEIGLLGTYQVKNAVLALEVLDVLKELGITLKEAKIREAMYHTMWPARFQMIDKKPYFLVDGAHNPQAAQELRDSIQFYFTNRKIIYIIGVFRDKEYDKVIETTCDLASHIITVAKKGSSRALPAYELAQEVVKVNPMVTVADSVEEAVELAYLLADKETVIIAFGSLAYLGDCIYTVEHRRDMRKDTHGQ